MARYDDWSKERLAWKCRELEREIEQLKNELQSCKDEKDHLQFVIDNELEQSELNEIYEEIENKYKDNYITDGLYEDEEQAFDDMIAESYDGDSNFFWDNL